MVRIYLRLEVLDVKCIDVNCEVLRSPFTAGKSPWTYIIEEPLESALLFILVPSSRRA